MTLVPTSLADRFRWLGHPAFFACVVVLFVNDHLLKDRYPGWWTGKLSDFAGLAVVGVILSTLLGPKRGLTVAVVSFVALKAVPGVAEVAAPLLGGVTRRDWTDLVALLVLLPVWWLLGNRGLIVEPATVQTGPPKIGVISMVRSAAATAAPIVGIAIAVGATTATSCAAGPAVVTVTSDGKSFFALVVDSHSADKWARSDDGGQSWYPSGVPVGQLPTVVPPTTKPTIPDSNAEGKPVETPGVTVDKTSPKDACTVDGTCWRIVGGRSIVRVSREGAGTTEHQLSNDELDKIGGSCRNGHAGILSSIAVGEIDGTVGAVASLGGDGVLVREEDGNWHRVGVLAAQPPIQLPSKGPTLALVALMGPLLGALVVIVGRKRSMTAGLLAVAVGWFSSSVFTGMTILLGPSMWRRQVINPIAVIGFVVTAVIAVVICRRRPAPPFSPMPERRWVGPQN